LINGQDEREPTAKAMIIEKGEATETDREQGSPLTKESDLLNTTLTLIEETIARKEEVIAIDQGIKNPLTKETIAGIEEVMAIDQGIESPLTKESDHHDSALTLIEETIAEKEKVMTINQGTTNPLKIEGTLLDLNLTILEKKEMARRI
jgi:hypothetical protein